MSAVPAARFLADFGAAKGAVQAQRRRRDSVGSRPQSRGGVRDGRRSGPGGRAAGHEFEASSASKAPFAAHLTCRAAEVGRGCRGQVHWQTACYAAVTGVRGTRGGHDGAHPEAVSCEAELHATGDRGAAGQSRRAGGGRPGRAACTSAGRRMCSRRCASSSRARAADRDLRCRAMTCDVRIVAGQATLETRLKGWMDEARRRPCREIRRGRYQGASSSSSSAGAAAAKKAAITAASGRSPTRTS